ncbi:MAG: ArsR/SmtB family transcription factor [Pseudomonadota bacterium]
MSDEKQTELQAELLRALAHGVRLELLQAIRGGERAVHEIEAATGIGQPGLSQQLAVLRKAGLVAARRDAKQVFYSIDRARVAEAARIIAALSDIALDPPPSGRLPPVPTPGTAMFARIG